MIHGDQKDSDILRRHIDQLVANIDAVGSRFITVTLTQHTYLDLLRRIRCTLLGVSLQLSQWPGVAELKLPISLLFRSVVTDVLTGLYLATFDTDEEALRNELMMLDLGFVGYVKTIFEHTGLEMPDAAEAEVAQEIQVRLDDLYAKAEHLLVAPGATQLKKSGQIRATSDPTLFKAGVPGVKLGSISEREMFEQIKAHPATRHLAGVYILQRHLSQSHHYAPANRGFIQLPPAIECKLWFEALVYAIEVTGLLSNLLKMPPEVIQPFRDSQASLSAHLLSGMPA